jgi:hypothetical protein
MVDLSLIGWPFLISFETHATCHHDPSGVASCRQGKADALERWHYGAPLNVHVSECRRIGTAAGTEPMRQIQ